jgi:hypothetical protein
VKVHGSSPLVGWDLAGSAPVPRAGTNNAGRNRR